MRFLAQALVIARRDFAALVLTPTFLVFLFAPLFMLGAATISSIGAIGVLEGARGQVAILAPASALPRLRAAEARVRRAVGTEPGPPLVRFEPDDGRAEQVLARADVSAVLAGDVVRYESGAGEQADYLALVAAAAEADPVRREERRRGDGVSARARSAAAFATVFAMFFLTLLLSSQAISMLAEERSSKVIEILAAAIPLEAVFFGKLIGLLGVALLFLSFWGGIGLVAAQASTGLVDWKGLAPDVGLPTFAALFLGYFILAFLLLSAVFLGVGAQAGTMREIQMLSLPVTIFQVAMFALSSAAANAPDESIGIAAALFPFSSPFAMAARAATGVPAWQHAAAFAWQTLWLLLTVTIAARLFRRGVLKSGGPRR